MLQTQETPEANGGHRHSFASHQSSNGNGSDPPGKREGRSCEPANPKQRALTDYSNGQHTQAQSGNSQFRHSNRVLLDERPLVLLPSLAKAVGVDGAIVIQQLHFHLANPDNGRVHDGEHWIYNTYEEWQERDFPFWSVWHIQRTLLDLEKRKLIVSCQPEGRSNRRKYYRIDYGVLEKVVKAATRRARAEHGKSARSMVAKVHVPYTRDNLPENTQGVSKSGVYVNLNVLRKPKGRSDGRGQAAQASSPKVLPYPKSAEAMHEALAKRDIELTVIERKHADKFFAQKEASHWTIKGEPVHDWVAALRKLLAKIKASSKTKPADWREREGGIPLHRMRINGLRRLRQKLLDEHNALFRAAEYDPITGCRVGLDKERMAELREKMDAIDVVEERKTGRSREVLKMERCAARHEQESAERRAHSREPAMIFQC